jgi:hypothetical protein
VNDVQLFVLRDNVKPYTVYLCPSIIDGTPSFIMHQDFAMLVVSRLIRIPGSGSALSRAVGLQMVREKHCDA